MSEKEIEEKARSEPKKQKNELTKEQRERHKKMIIYPAMFAVFGLAMWLIFAPSEKEKKQLQFGFNTDIPAPTENILPGDKQKAYEEELVDRKQQERRQLQDLASMFGMEETKEVPLYIEEPKVISSNKRTSVSGNNRSKQTIEASANAYRDINRTLGNFYENPKEDPEKTELKERLAELEKQLANQQSPQDLVNEQLAIMEKSYELAAKYMPLDKTSQLNTSSETSAKEDFKNGKARINNIGAVYSSIVSGLSQPITDSAFIADYSKPRNYDFHTAIGKESEPAKNTIKACIYDNQTITDGQSVRMRLLEPMKAGNTILPRNTIVTGMGKIQGERLSINILNLEYQGMIIPVELTVIDTDGQQGIFIPGSMEINAIKEVAANLGGNLGTTINLNQQSAGDQLLTDLGKGAIQGASQYISKKMRIVKVHLKAGYQLMLYQDK